MGEVLQKNAGGSLSTLTCFLSAILSSYILTLTHGSVCVCALCKQRLIQYSSFLLLTKLRHAQFIESVGALVLRWFTGRSFCRHRASHQSIIFCHFRCICLQEPSYLLKREKLCPCRNKIIWFKIVLCGCLVTSIESTTLHLTAGIVKITKNCILLLPSGTSYGQKCKW